MDTTLVSHRIAVQCRQIIDLHLPDYIDSAQRMLQVPLSPADTIHPMLRKVYGLAEEVVNPDSDDATSQEAWDNLHVLVDNYLDGKWSTTCLTAVIIYGLINTDKLDHTFSIAITRQNGKSVVESGEKTLRLLAEKLASSLNPAQTDAWFLQNLIERLPAKHADFHLQSAHVIEQLLE